VNLLRSLPDASAAECVDALMTRPGLRFERIVSFGQASPPGFWYDQSESEWVLLLAGTARLRASRTKTRHAFSVLVIGSKFPHIGATGSIGPTRLHQLCGSRCFTNKVPFASVAPAKAGTVSRLRPMLVHPPSQGGVQTASEIRTPSPRTGRHRR
jgi:cupin 2 domain-containing protein